MAHGLVPDTSPISLYVLASNRQLGCQHSEGRAYTLGHLSTPVEGTQVALLGLYVGEGLREQGWTRGRDEQL